MHYSKQAELGGKSFKVGDHVIFEGRTCTVLQEIDDDGDILIQDETVESLKNDKEVVLAAVAQDGLALEYADESLKKDKDVVLAAVAQCGSALECADESLK